MSFRLFHIANNVKIRLEFSRRAIWEWEPDENSSASLHPQTGSDQGPDLLWQVEILWEQEQQ